MNHKNPPPYAALDKLFHEPSRLALLSALCGQQSGMTFNELKEACHLTDGNLSRHLKTLEESRVVQIRKSFRGSKPLTLVQLSDAGREGFIQYLAVLEEVLTNASASVRAQEGMFSLFWEQEAPLDQNAV